MKEERLIQQDLKSNLKSLKGTIERTRESVEDAKARKEELLDARNVQWNLVIELEDEISGYEAGLKKLKEIRDTQFPNWKDILIED